MTGATPPKRRKMTQERMRVERMDLARMRLFDKFDKFDHYSAVSRQDLSDS
jgi:hypothetical protein